MSSRKNRSFSHHKRCKSSLSSYDERSSSRLSNANSSIDRQADSAYKTADRPRRSPLKKNRNLSVRDMIKTNKSKGGDFGIQGYHIPTFNAYLDKPKARKWLKTKVPSVWDAIKRRSQKTPSPNHYQK